MNKYILVKNKKEGFVMRYANTDFHKNLVYKEDETFGGGMFDFSEDGNTLTLYGRSEDFGLPKFDSIKEKIHIDEDLAGITIRLLVGYTPDWKADYKNITDKFIFDYF